MREFMVGFIAVGLFAGISVGRVFERAKRGYKDLGAAKTALETATKNWKGLRGKAVSAIAITGLVMIALFLGAMNLPH